LVADLEVLNQLRKSYHRAFTPENRKQFAELYFDLLQVLDTEKIQRDSIANLFNMQAVIASNRLNDFMKKVTVVAILVAVPTFISGIYGMNVKLPFQESEHTFWLLIGIMATIASALIILFRAVEKR
jgi:magnesium transporter